jgi:acyl-CoA synthetase (AMP-forming)/AMP-acid ligase II
VSEQAEPLAAVVRAGEAGATALACPDDGSSISFGELAERADTLARALRGLGVERGDRVALALPNGPEIVELLFAVTALGAAAAPLNPAYTPDELTFYLEDLGPRLLLLPEGELEAARTAAARLSVPIADVGSDDARTVLGSSAPPAAYDPGAPDDVAILLHTSGTTSRPKQVPLLQRNLVASARSMAGHYRLSADDVSYVAMPLFHVHGLVASTFAALLGGGTVVVPRRLAPRRFWGHLGEHGVTWVSAGPTIHHMLLERSGKAPPAGLRFTRSCSSALSPELLARCEEAYGVPMLEAYGMTEASHEMAANPLPPGERRPGSVGIATGAAVRIVDSSWNDVPEGADGEVVVSGPGLTPGYLNNPGANAESFSDGWFRTGDQGVLDGGYLRLVGRIKELIIRGGENISPGEVEEALLSHPAVADAAVFGVPDEKYGEVVAAAVSLDADADEAILIDHCRERLTAVKVPAVIHILESIPRTPTGKLQRRRVAAAIYGEP